MLSEPAGLGEAALLSDILETQNDLAAVELDPRIIMRIVADRIQKLTRADGAAVARVEGEFLVCHTGSGMMAARDGERLPLATSLAGCAIRTGKFHYAEDVKDDPRVERAVCRQLGIRSLVVVPLFNGGQALGVIAAASRSPRAFGPNLISALRLMSGLVVASLSHAAEFEIKRKLLAERTEALAALRASEQRFHSAFKHAAIGMALVGLDGRWLQVNQAICRIVGYTEKELLASDFQSITFPDDLNADLSFVRELIAGQITDYQMIKRYVHREGHLVWVLLSVSLVRDDGGRPVYFISQIQDITQRQHAEAALRASEEEYRATFELAGVGKVQVDLASGRFLRVNQKFCQITGYSADELHGLTLSQITHPDDLEISQEAASRMLRRELRDYSCEKRYIRKSGEEIWVSVNSAAIKDPNGNPTRTVKTVLDITERKRAERLERDRRLVLEMVATDLPLPKVLDRLAEAVERQIDGCIAGVLALQDGTLHLHGANLPAEWRALLESQWLPFAASLAAGAWASDGACGATDLLAGDAWPQFQAAAEKAGFATCWTSMIQAVDGTALGLLMVFYRSSRRPTAVEVQTLDMAGKLATICIEHHQTTSQLSRLVRFDYLTGLPNRLMFEDRMQQALAVARRTRRNVGLLVLDIDRFKAINDSMGHHAGDHLLQQFAQRLQARLRDTDTMARIGGDEFVVVLPELDSREAAAAVSQKLVDALAEPFTFGDQSLQASTSIGIALFPQDGEDALTLQKNADAALYRAKDRGRNTYSF